MATPADVKTSLKNLGYSEEMAGIIMQSQSGLMDRLLYNDRSADFTATEMVAESGWPTPEGDDIPLEEMEADDEDDDNFHAEDLE